MIAKLARRVALVFSVLICTSCGSGELLALLLASGGIGGTGISFGPIAGFGSIFVNGVEFQTSGATVIIDGSPASEGDLKKGMVVTVQGTIDGDTGIATTILAESAVKGPVDEDVTDPNASTVQVLGQTIQVDDTVVLDGSDGEEGNFTRLDSLREGMVVAVSGLVKSNGSIAATRIELLEVQPTEFRVEGFIENVNTTLQTFNIGDLAVNYSAADLSDLPGGIPADGLLVAAEGPNSLSTGGELLATKVELQELGVFNAERAEISGFVKNDENAPSEFTMGNLTVQTNSSTLFAGGTAAEIAAETKLEVEGVLVNGVMVADKVSFLDNITLESDADVVNVFENTVTLVGLPGITVNVDELTTFTNATGLDDINPGDHLQIRGRLDTNSKLVATQLRRELPTSDVTLQGPVDTAADPNVVILGVTVDTIGFLDDQFKGLDDLPIGRAAFFDPAIGVTPGTLVRVYGELLGGVVGWDEVGFED